jgi:hypothetical protein
MDKTIARLNIEHYRKSLATEQDETKRQTLMRLLAEEQSKLAALDPPEKKTAQSLASLLPRAPMRGPHVDTFLSLGINPTAEDATARKHQSVHAVVTDNCEFKIAAKWRGGYKLPIHRISPVVGIAQFPAIKLIWIKATRRSA